MELGLWGEDSFHAPHLLLPSHAHAKDSHLATVVGDEELALLLLLGAETLLLLCWYMHVCVCVFVHGCE